MHICSAYIMWLKRFMPWKVPAVVDWHVVHCFRACDLKARQINVPICLIRELVFYELQRGHNAADAAENIS